MNANPDIRFEETAKGGRYFIVMPNGELSRLTYVTAGAGHIIADRTFVPPPYRNQGLAEAMVSRLIADARSAGLKVTPTCWFVADEFERHSPDWDDVLMRRAG
jgi:predicted GNAT family acetyltransferase